MPVVIRQLASSPLMVKLAPGRAVPSMEETIKLIKDKAPWCKTVVGGAVLTQEYADKIGADKYCADAMETVRYAETVLG